MRVKNNYKNYKRKVYYKIMALTQEEFAKLKTQLATQKKRKTDFVSRSVSDIKLAGKGVEEAISGTGEFAGQTPLRRGVEATAQAFNVIPKIASEALPEVARKGISKVGEMFSGVVSLLGDKIGDKKIIQDWIIQHPKAAKTLEEIAGTLSATGEIAGDILAVEGGTKALQKTADLTTKLAAKTFEKTGETTAKVGEKVYKSAFDLTADEARRVQANKIQVKFLEKERASLVKGSKEYQTITKQIDELKAPILRADTALEKGIAGTEKQIGVQSGVEKMDLWKNKVEPALENSKEIITKDELFAKARQTVAKEADLTRKASLQTALEAIETDYADFVNTSLKEANKIKTSLAKFTPSKIFKGQEVASGVKTLQADMASAIREKTYSSLKDINIKKAYLDYSNLKELEKVGIRALTETGTKGGFGGFWSTIYDHATIPIKTVGGKILYRVGNKLEFVGEKGIRTFGQFLKGKNVKIIKP